jgi:GntR family transcriptional regulator
VTSRPGVGTYIERSLADASISSHTILRQQLIIWIRAATEAGLDQANMEALFTTTLRQITQEVNQ